MFHASEARYRIEATDYRKRREERERKLAPLSPFFRAPATELLKMQAVQNGKFLNPRRGVQISEDFLGPANKFYNYGEWELPGGAAFTAIQGDVTIMPPMT